MYSMGNLDLGARPDRTEHSVRKKIRRQETEGIGHKAYFEFGIADCETGNPPVGWESEGQFKSKLVRSQNPEFRREIT
jgi:hypothetical protein